jgi:uncharacterized membrane protein YjgN (DUF898 family)
VCCDRSTASCAPFGNAHARFEGRAGAFYGSYLLAAAMLIGTFLLFLGTALLLAAAGHGVAGSMGMVIFMLLFFYGVMIAMVPFVTARVQNSVWCGTRLEAVDFASDVRAGKLIEITLGNLLMIVFSLGLLIPFAVMRLMKCKIESTGSARRRRPGQGSPAMTRLPRSAPPARARWM